MFWLIYRYKKMVNVELEVLHPKTNDTVLLELANVISQLL